MPNIDELHWLKIMAKDTSQQECLALYLFILSLLLLYVIVFIYSFLKKKKHQSWLTWCLAKWGDKDMTKETNICVHERRKNHDMIMWSQCSQFPLYEKE